MLQRIFRCWESVELRFSGAVRQMWRGKWGLQGNRQAGPPFTGKLENVGRRAGILQRRRMDSIILWKPGSDEMLDLDYLYREDFWKFKEITLRKSKRFSKIGSYFSVSMNGIWNPILEKRESISTLSRFENSESVDQLCKCAAKTGQAEDVESIGIPAEAAGGTWKIYQSQMCRLWSSVYGNVSMSEQPAMSHRNSETKDFKKGHILHELCADYVIQAASWTQWL